MTDAWAGGGPDYEYPQQVAIQEVAQPDAFDKVYLALREFVPGWMILSFIFVGAIVIGVLVFRKQIKAILNLLQRLINNGV